jgi:MFS transporter, OFA family, oxalate/formate antiporter
LEYKKGGIKNALALERNVVVLGSTSMVATFGNYTWSFFLPLYFSTIFGATPVLISVLYTGWYGMIALSSTLGGFLSDKYGRRPVVGAAGFISAGGVSLLAISHYFILSALGFIVTGIGTGLLQTSYVIVAESVEKERRGTAMGTFQLFTYLTAGLSPIIGGVTLAGSNNDFFPLFIFGAILAFVAASARALLIRETLHVRLREPDEKPPSLLKNLNQVFGDRTLVGIVIAYALYNLFLNQQSFIVPLYTRNALNLNYVSMGGIFAVFVIISAISRLPFGKLSDKIGRVQTIAISWVGESLFVFVFVFAPKGNADIAALGIGLWTIFGVMDGPAVNAWIADRADPKSRGLSMGIFSTASLLLSLPGVLFAGILFAISPQLPFYANSALGLGCLGFLLVLNRYKSPSLKPQ